MLPITIQAGHIAAGEMPYVLVRGSMVEAQVLSMDAARQMAVAAELVASLRETLIALEGHIALDAEREGVKPHVFCPCTENEVARARAVLAKAGAA